MSVADVPAVPAAPDEDPIPADLRREMQDARMMPLWESPNPLGATPERAHCWPWSLTAPIMAKVGAVSSPKIVERRVLHLIKPTAQSERDETASGTITAALQILLSGEKARPHRHSMNAIRFVMEGAGAATLVDGKKCDMQPGDFILTPAWCWHEHVNDGDEPVIWADVLDVALHFFLGTHAFEPGPITSYATQIEDGAFPVPGVVPDVNFAGRSYSPIFRYPWADVVRALAAAPVTAAGFRRVTYVDPLTGGPAMSTLDCSAVQLEPGRPTRASKSSASSLYIAVEGQGESEIGGKRIAWRKNDIFTVPCGNAARHEARDGLARLFVLSDAEVYRRLGLFSEVFAD